MRRNVLLYEGDRSLLLFLLITDYRDNFIYITSEYTVNKDAFCRLKGHKIVLKDAENLGFTKGKWVKKIYKSMQKRLGFYIFRKIRKRINTNSDIMLYGLPHTFMSTKVFSTEPISFIEEGVGDISLFIYDRKRGFKYKFFLKLNKYLRKKRIWWIEKFGIDPNMKEMYVMDTVYKGISDAYNKKLISVRDLWYKKPIEEKEYILKVFGVNSRLVESFPKGGIWLYTQPLSEDHILTELEKVELYKKIINKYDKSNLIIKKHPRERTDYRKYFPDIKVFDYKISMELLECMDILPNKAVTICSSAVFSINGISNIDFYGSEVHEKIFKEFGNLDKIYKRNAYL